MSRCRKVDVVLGAVFGYDFPALAPFVLSLQRGGFEGETVLLGSGLHSDTVSTLQQQGVRVEPIRYRGSGAMNSWSRFWAKLAPIVRRMPSPLARKVIKNLSCFQTARFFHYLDYLSANRSRFRNVFLTDVRDVYFQRSPFALAPSDMHGIRVYEEDPSVPIGEETLFNAPWIRGLFGDDALNEIAHCPVICSGTILGDIDSIIDFLTAFTSLAQRARELSVVGEDQGIHNYLCRTEFGRDRRVEVVPNGGGEVFTFVHFAGDSHSLNSDGDFTVRSGGVVPVLHQYDRVPEIERELLERLACTPCIE
ncbi:MAG: hypothetical protein KDA44_06645 [Planctomycetales bacterium]|nr:hypothetical protein [Planctomycetales bacterium]